MEDFKVDMLAGGFALAEGPLYDSGRDTLYAVDINAPGFYQYDFRTGGERRFPTPSHCTAVVQTDDEKLLLVALAQELVFFDKDGLTFTPYRKVELGEGMRFNDGAVGPDGALYIGTMMIDGPRSQVGRLIRIDREGERVMEGFTFTVPNGIAFTKDYFYHIDSPADTLRRFHIEGDRLVEEKSFRFPAGSSPDGMALAEGGLIYVALWNKCAVAILDFDRAEVVGHIYTGKKCTSAVGIFPDGRLAITAGRADDGDGLIMLTRSDDRPAGRFLYRL